MKEAARCAPWILAATILTAAGGAAAAEASSRGMAATAHPLATEAALGILKSGGNAFDAAIAAAAALNVVEPMMSGVGGYGTILVYDAKKREARFLNASDRIPAAVDSDAFRPPTPGHLENRRGAKAVSTPGNLRAWEAMWKSYGSRPWPDLFAPAILLAEEGFPVSSRVASAIEAGYPDFPDHAKTFYGKDGVPLRAGERLIQKDLAGTLRLIARHRSRVLYSGSLGRAIDAAMRESGGFLSLRDLRRARAEWWRPISIRYRGYEVVTASPPANAFDMLARLGMMSRVDARALGHNTVDFLDLYAGVTTRAFALRIDHATDPEIRTPPLGMLLSPDFWQRELDRIRRADRPRRAPDAEPADDSHTTHFVVADRWGNVVSATQTLGGLFGSRIMPEGTGIWLNNSLAYSTFEPKGNPMDAFPGRHKLSGDCPTLVMSSGRPWIALGTPGGHTIGQTVPQIIMNVIDFGMDLEEAVAAPRISFLEPDAIAMEEAIPEETRKQLAGRGHTIRTVRALGNAHALSIEYDAGGSPARFTGAADPRGEGAARGY